MQEAKGNVMEDENYLQIQADEATVARNPTRALGWAGRIHNLQERR